MILTWENAMRKAAIACVLLRFPALQFVDPLKAVDSFSGMGGPGQDETCEHCGSPLDDSGVCWSCSGGGFVDGSSPVGTAPLEKAELSKVLKRSVGERAHGAYALSFQQEEGMSHLREEIDSLVEQFNASPQVKNSVKQNSQRNAIKLSPHLGPTNAAIAAVAQEFLSLGRDIGEVSLFIARVHPRIGRLSSLVLEVLANEGRAVGVLVSGQVRDHKSYSEGLYLRLRIPIYCWDEGAVVELTNAILCKGMYPEERVKLIGPSKFVLVLPEKTFQLFKILEEAKLSGAISVNEQPVDPLKVARKYSIAKLAFTERFLRETGYLNAVNIRYTAILRERLKNGRGRMPRKLAEEALVEACSQTVPTLTCELVARKYHLKPSRMSSLVVLPELEAWQRTTDVSWETSRSRGGGS